MDREALHMEKTMTLITRLFVLGTSIKYMVLISATPRNLCSNHGEDKVGDKPLGCGGAAGGV